MRLSPRPRTALPLAVLLAAGLAFGVEAPEQDAFRQIDPLLPTPNVYRTASGQPGHAYWQQRADYDVEVTLDEDAARLEGSERITYHNASPDELPYLWVQLDPNLFAPESHSVRTALSPDLEDGPSYSRIRRVLARAEFDGGLELGRVADGDGNPLPHTVIDTMMRVDLPEPLASGGTTELRIDWSYDVNDADLLGGRTGYEHFEEDGNRIFEIAQWFPRMAAYTDMGGWHNEPFLGRGEFTLEFGDYEVAITVPDDHLVAATGVLQNPEEVLEPRWRERLDRARTSGTPVFVVTPEEAEANESSEPASTKTWVFRAEDVRDFAWASSRKFAWDAMGVEIDGRTVMAMSFYPGEGEPLWSRYSTHAVAHTLEVYSRFVFPYPYPTAISVNGPVYGMEYPMICFNGPRPEPDGTYSARTKYGLISVVIHEVGHNWFPMIVNSDERQWTWMDEGLNSFVQYLAEKEWEDDYPSRWGDPDTIVDYMTDERQRPIMTGSESILQFGNNAYAKPATALAYLRETVVGREAFDFAFRRYGEGWRFRRPAPADLFRSLEDASGSDLDWFWRGWFYGTDHVDVAIDGVRLYRIDTRDPDVEKPIAKAERDETSESVTERRNASIEKRIEAFPELADFYDEFDELDVTEADREEYEKLLEDLDEPERELLSDESLFYVVDLANRGGLVTPVTLRVEHADGTSRDLRLPADVWRRDPTRARKLVVCDREAVAFVLDPRRELPDADRANDRYPRAIPLERFRMEQRPDRDNPMREARERAEANAAEPAGDAEAADAGAEAAEGASSSGR